MTNPAPPFSPAEYARRIAKTRQAMAEAGIDLLYVQDPSNMAWLTGYDGWSFYTHQGVLLGHEGDPIWWGRTMNYEGAKRTVWMPDDCVRRYADPYVQTPERHPMEDLARLIDEVGGARARIGVELEGYYFSVKAYFVLGDALPGARLVDATNLVNWQRTVKSEEELDFMRRAAKIANVVVRGAIDRVQPGVRKNEVVAEILRDQAMGVGEDWGDYPAIVPMMPSGMDAAAAHMTWNGDPFRRGEATFMELAACYRRYHTPLCRTVFLGKLPDHIARAEAALLEGLEAGIDAARAGNRACDIAREISTALARIGIERHARCGYPIGLSYPPDWGERTISIREEDQTVLEPDMTFHFMPGLWMDDWGIEITESIRIRDSGPAECFCDVPRGIAVKD